MPGVLALTGLFLVLLISGARSESAELRFQGHTEFVVNESSRAIVRLVVERVGDPINVTALVLLQGEDTGDFEATTAAAFLLSSESSRTIFIAVKDDDLPEADETFVFNLRLQSSSNGVTVGTPNTARITILSNDNAFGIISFNTTSPITVEEPKGRHLYVPLTLIREKGTYGSVTVSFEILGGPNPASEDLSPDKGNLTIPPGQAVVIFSILINDDKVPEDDEIFTVQLTGVAGGALLNTNGTSVQIKISRNDAPVSFLQPFFAVSESAGIVNLTVTRGRTDDGFLIGSDDREVSVMYTIVTGNGAASATLLEDFVDLQPRRVVVFPPRIYEAVLHFNITDDRIPEIAESFQVVLLEETLLGDAVLVPPSCVQVTIEPNDKPYGVLSISSPPPAQPVIINEDTTIRFENITIVRNGGTHGLVSVNWTITRNFTDRTPVSSDLSPVSGTLFFPDNQTRAILPLNITQDDLPEEAEPFLLRLIPQSVQGGAEVDEPMEMIFYIQDSDDIYGRFGFHPHERQSIQSQPEGRFLSLSFFREAGTLGEVRLAFTAFYIPAGTLDPARARDGVLNGTSANNLLFSSGQSRVQFILPIRNDAFLQNGARFLIQLDSLQLVNIITPIPSVSPRFGGAINISLLITPDIANGEIGFTSNQTVVATEPEDSNTSMIILSLRRDGTDGQAVVFWSIRAVGENRADVTRTDLSPFSGSVTFLTGQSEANISITIMADNVPEINETVLLTLDRTNTENQILKSGFTSREIVILENDDPGGVFEFSSVSRGPWFINEGETVELRVIREQGQLLNQLVRYTVTPSGNEDFYGAIGILEFQPGEREVVVALVAIPDGLPELDEMFAVGLSSHSTPASRLGNNRQVNITVRKSDDPFGVLQFIQPQLMFSINESKGMDIHSASYPIVRGRGRFGNVSVFWILEPTFSGDVTPVQGEVVFTAGEYLKNITIFSKPDEVPEDIENFTITLINATGGARLGNILNASLQINKNDDPIYFAEPVIQRVREGGVANFTILRAGLANFVATVMYRFELGDSSTGDFIPSSNDSLLVFDYGEWMKNISVTVWDDDIPETDEPFYIVLFNATGDAVVYGKNIATVVIEANDDANGIFSLDATEKPVEEGKSNNFYVIRNRGHFGNVTVFWQLFANYTPLEPSQEFVNTSGFIVFTTGEKSKSIVLEAISDKLPEFNEFFELRLMNISGGYPGEGGKLATKDLSASVLIPFNDDPFGVFAIDKANLDQEVAEDILSVDDTLSIASFTILRQQGTFGDVRVSWEILSEAFPQGLPPMQDFILMATFPEAVKLQPHARRHHSGTDAFFFSGLPGSYGTITPKTDDIPSKLVNFTFSAWLMPKPNTDGFIVSKGNGNGTMYYGIKVQTNESHVSVMLHYTTVGSNNTQVAKAIAMKFVEDNVWVHVIVALEDGIIEFYLDGNPMSGGIKSLKGEAIMNDAAPVNIGSDLDGHQLFTGVLQDVRLYSIRLNQSQIHELHGQPAKTDFRNVAGYLAYWQGEKLKSFIVETRDDREEEGEEVFYLQLVAVHGGARLPMPRPTARIRIMKSDNANGLFGFTGACIPDILEEGSTVTCIVERTRGVLDSVYVNYTVTQLDSPARSPNVSDFAKPTGSVFFPQGQQYEVLNLQVLDDDLPEFDEYFQVKLVSAQSGDGKQGSTPTSGASIDFDNAINNVTIKASDHPYGLLQFQTAPVTQEMIRPAIQEAHITVNEEAGIVKLPVARAQGLLGRVLVAYRTTPVTAIGSEDYENAEGLLDFLPGERLKYINLTIIDNSVPELDKVFRVELYNPQGGVDMFFGSGDSGSGESDIDFFLPPFHYHSANLGLASHITVTIAASDEAHGVFQFSNNSISVNGTEPEEGRSNVMLQVIRTFGTLSNVTVYWQADSDSEGELINRSGILTFTVGQTIGNIFLHISQDDTPELDKNFKIRLLNVSHGRLGSQTVSTLTVLASDDPYGLFLFSERSRPIRVAEADTVVVLTIQRTKGLMGRVQVTYRTLKDTDPGPYPTPGLGRASARNDYIPISESVTFSINQSEANVTVRILDDKEPERAESVFVELSSVTLMEGAQTRPVALSPQLGLRNVSVAQVIIEASDDAFGVLQLSSTSVSVPEYYVGPIINVTRTGGIFADVSVKFRAVPMTARVGEDYSVASSDVVLLEGESSKPVPILIINDMVPELEETFRIELLNQTTGGAFLGELTQAIITILPSDDPYGSFVFQAAPVTVEEPMVNAIEVSLPIVRNAGTIGYVSVKWRATINGRPATGDIQPLSGEVSFAPGETMQTLIVEILADDVPEIEEIIKLELIGATNGGSIGLENVVNVILPANDNPYGTVQFVQAVYRVQEPLEGMYLANISVQRSGGNFGRLEILYSTFEIDVVTNAQKNGYNFRIYYNSPLAGAPSSAIQRPINITTTSDPLNSCAAFCLRTRACQAFSFINASTATCFWVTTSANQLSAAAQTLTYIKNTTAAASLFSSQATAGSDYVTMIGQTATMLDGSSIANLTVPILSDSLPEMDESFMIQILKVGLVNMTVAEKHLPTVRQPDTATVTIGMNGDAFGVFKLYSVNPSATQNGLYLEVREEPGTRVLLVIERTGGSLGRVTVEWMNVGGTARPNADFNGTGETLVFAEGDVRKTIEFIITDDTEPEDNETMQIGLVGTEGGSRILPSSDTVTILILANDHAAGLVGFHPASRSVIVKEGERVPLHVQRTTPAIGNVTVEWRIEGSQALLTFVQTSGVLFFPEHVLNDTIVLQLLDDGIPEEKEEYRVILSKIQTKGVTVTGEAAVDAEGHEAVVSVAASDEPFGMLRIAPSSLNISTDEKDIKLRIYINREFGASGSVNISYETVKGSLQDLRLVDGALAEPGQDFQHVSSFVVMQDGQTSVSIPITIIDDDIPELKEFFLLNITSAVLITSVPTAPSLEVHYRLKDTQGLVAEISINANDGIQGIISWQSTNYKVNETIGALSLVAYRDAGTYGNVSVFFYAQNLEAQLGLDFSSTASVLHFANGERYKFVEVVILDDPIPEGDEEFQLILTNPSPGLELGKNVTATVTILANDDGHGIISFNNSEHFLLQEPTSVSGLGHSVAMLSVVRNPPQGIFGTVTVQFSISDANGTLNTEDLTPSEGFVVLEDGVRFKTLEIWAVLDAEPEMNETFRVSLFNPTGGARLGEPLETFITVLQNQAPLGLFRIFLSSNRTLNSLIIEETVGTVYLTLARSNGLDSAVSVEFETNSDAAFGMRGDYSQLAVYQRFRETWPLGWCSVFNGNSSLLLMLMQDQVTLYRWQGVFVSIQNVSVQRPGSCVGFTVNGTTYVAVAHEDTAKSPAANVSIFLLQPDLNLTLAHTRAVGSRDVKHFSVQAREYFIALNQVFVWTGNSLSLHHTLEIQDITTLAPFTRANRNIQHLVACRGRNSSSCLVYQWINSSFQNPQPLAIGANVKQVESIHTGGETFLLVTTEGPNPTCEVLLWSSQQTFFQFAQSIPFPGLSSVHAFTPPSGILHLLLAGKNDSALYMWMPELIQFTKVLKSSSTQQFLYLSVPSFNVTKSLIIATQGSASAIYELIAVSNQSDFIPRSAELFFQPGVSELEIAVNIVDDDIPEVEEGFRVSLKNPKGGAEIGFHSQVTLIISANDDAYGVIGFSQSSMAVEVEELDMDNLFSLRLERRRGSFGRLTVRWAANGSLQDISPTFGVVTFSESQTVATISLTVLADGIPELEEKVAIIITDVTTVGVVDLSKRAVIDPQRARAEVTIKANGSPYGVIGWHLDSQNFITSEPLKSPSNITLSIVRDQGASGNVVVHYTTRPALSLPPVNQASEGQDYDAKQARVIMMENATVALVTITILPDDIPELAETFLVNITGVELMGNQSGAGQPRIRRPGMEIAEITIQENDDPRGVLQFNVSKDSTGLVFAHEVPPPGNILYLPVVRLAGRTGRLVLFWEAQTVIATVDDFTPSSGNLTFQDGQGSGIIEITIIDDTLVEPMETFLVKLTQVVGGARLGTDASVLVNIPANDSPLGRFGFQELTTTVSEPQFPGDPASMVNLTVVRSSGGEGTVYLIWLLEQRGRDDLQPHNGSLVFNGSESRKSVLFQALADAVLEGEEMFTVQLLSARNEAVIDQTRNLATIVIRADRGALGIIGIADSSHNVLIGEPQGMYNGTAFISLERGPGIFGEIEIYWNITPATANEFVENSGKVIMRDRQSAATIQLMAVDDDIPEEKRVYELSLTSLTPGADINLNRQLATITMAASDLPYGLFSFTQSSLSVMEDERSVNITVVRSMGLLGNVLVNYYTEGQSAVSGLDFEQASGRILFGPGQSSRVITLKIVDDLLAEGPEDFYLSITEVHLLNDSALNFTIRENGFQMDQPPAIGNISFIRIIIQKNDNVEGILEFDPSYINITVEEDVGTFSVPILRRVGTYGQVSIDYITRSLTALSGSDYILFNGTISFRHGQNTSSINVSIVDDLDRESNEVFEIQLVAASGGAILGTRLIAQITIAKSDSPSGMVRFVNQTMISISNPDRTLKLILVLERFGGVVGDAMITWNILGPNTNEVLPAVNTDFGEPVNGSFHFRDGQGGTRSFELQILPHGEVEVEETFIIKLSHVFGDMDVDPRAGAVTLRIAKFGDPNGIVQFTEQDLREHVYSEPADYEAPLNISLLITRREGVMGNITVFWEILSDSDTTGDFLTLSGSVTILAGQRLAEIILTLLPDPVPELEEVYTVHLSSVVGGAEIDANRSSVRLRVRANDEPHGVFALFSEHQNLLVNSTDHSRYLVLNISRLAGTFGNVSVGYQISFPTLGQNFTEDRSVGSFVVKDGEKSASITVPISTQLFFVTGFNITMQLMNVSLIGPLLSSPPRVQLDARIAILSVPEEAANAEVGFASLDLQVSDIRSGRCDALVSRTGLYGDVTVQWRAGFPPGQTPSGYQPGTIIPSSGTVTLLHGQKSKIISFRAENNMSLPVAHAVHLTTIESVSPGGARFRPGYTVAEVESLGLYQFHPDFQKLAITEDAHIVTIYVQRLYGFRTNRTEVYYKTWPGSAHPGEDFTPVHDGQLLFEGRQTSAAINISILDDSLMEPDETFYVNLTNIRIISAHYTSVSARPLIVAENSISAVTILANDVIIGFGLLSIGPAMSRTYEDTQEGTQPQKVVLRVRRTAGQTGVVSARVRVYDGGHVSPELHGAPFLLEHNGTWAMEGNDFRLESQTVTLLEGQTEAEVSLLILDDQEPEGQEVFFIYLSEPEGGAQIVSSPDESGITFFAKIIILGSDLHNGIVGFTLSSQTGQVLDEDSDNRTTILFIQRQENRAFEDVFVSWRATFNLTAPALLSQGVNLTQELQQTSGRVLCRRGQVLCLLHLEIRPDQEPEFQAWFLVEIYEVGDGAAINQSARIANITMLESDDPRGLVYFAVGSRLPVAMIRANSVTLQVYREGSVASAISVKYQLQELSKAESVGPNLIWPAVADVDFIMASGELTFDIGQHSAGLDITLTPNIGSSNPTPKRFRVILSDVTGGARVHPVYGMANVTLVSDSETQAVWALLEQLHQPLDETLINRVLQGIINKVSIDLTHEQMTAVLDAAGKILSEAEQTPLKDSSRALTCDLLCSLAKPSRADTRGLSFLATVAERFAFSLVADTPCSTDGQRGKILDTCPYFTITAYHWYPTDINAHTFTGTNGDTLTLPDALLEVPVLPAGGMFPLACQKIHFIEYHTEHWFLTNTKASALNDKVFSVSLQGRGSRPLGDGKEVVYRIHTPNPWVKPRQSLCLLWNQAAESWLSDGQFCRVRDDSGNFVECACSHLSIYTASAEIDSLSLYNEAFYTAGFICISGFALAIISHVLCSRFPMFAAKLLTHMMVACLGTQICFLVSAFRGRMFSDDSCATLGLFFHYFHLSQFSWMLIQAVNFWQTLVMNDEHTERRYLLYFLLSWGLPALVIIILVTVLLGGYSWSIHDVYGLVQGELCFIPNVYIALCTAAFIPVSCVVGVLVVFIHAYHVTQQWKAYDDVYRGRTNSSEVPMVLYLYALVSLVCLWAGLHMAYRYLWMLILLVIFNILLGLYVFAVYFLMHNQLCWPAKATYTVEMNGHDGADGVFQSTGAATVGGGEISKSTQNLISAMEEISADWERTSLQPSIEPSSVFKETPQSDTYPPESGFVNANLIQDEESQEFDDLIFALKTGSGLNLSDSESIHGSHDGASVANSQIVELRRIPIADTHL